MDKKIPYPKVILEPFNLNDMHTIDALSGKVCLSYIKEMLIKHTRDCFTAHGFNYPTEPKEFYIVPFNQIHLLKNFSLKLPKYAVLWLPSVALHATEIIEKSPEDLKELAVIAWDFGNFSVFKGNHVLAVDLSMGFATFVLWENKYSFNQECCFLAEAE